MQAERFTGQDIRTNSQMSAQLTKKYCALDGKGNALMESAFRNLQLSARARDRILKVARTIADLEGSADIAAKHVAEAVQYRSLDKKYRV